MKPNKKDTLSSREMAYFFANLEEKPVYAHCAYNNYRLMKIVDIGHCYVLMSPEEEGCWMPSDSIKDNKKETPKTIITNEDDNGPELA
jgi:hypothetical protein